MKTVYQSPVVRTIEMNVSDSLLLSTSETEVSGTNGGWVKEDVTNTTSRYNVWDDDWSK